MLSIYVAVMATAAHRSIILNDLDLFVRQVGDKSPESVTVKDVDEFIDNQMEKQLKPATINRRIASLHTFFEYLAS